MRRGQVGVLLAVTSGLFSVLLAIAVNVATGGTLPGPLGSVAWLAWPLVGVFGLAGIGLAVWQQHLATTPQAPSPPLTASEPAAAREPLAAPEPAGLEPLAAPEPAGLESLDAPEPAGRGSVDAGGGVPAELPAAPKLFGREDLAGEVGRLVAAAGVVVIAAAPGAGKTALALRVAHDVRARFPDGQLYAPLLGASAQPARPEAVLARFLGALGVPARERRGGVDRLAARFRSAVADRAILVVLDDARHAAQVAPLLPGGMRCAAIVTSRSPLAELAGARLVSLGALGDEAGLALLADAAGADRVAADPDGARALVAACGGLPLAVRIAGGRLRARARWTPSQLAARLAGEQDRLDELRQGELAVRATFRGAYDGLPDLDRLVFRRAGSHPAASFGPEAAAARAGLPRATVVAALERLADGFLVDSPAPGRYALHDLLRLFAAETLREAGEASETAARLLRRLAAGPGPADQAVDQAADQPVDQTAGQPVDQTAGQAVDQAAEQTVGQPVDQTAGQPVDRGAGQARHRGGSEDDDQAGDGLVAALREGLDAGLREEVLTVVDAWAPRLADPFERLAAWQAAAEAAAVDAGAAAVDGGAAAVDGGAAAVDGGAAAVDGAAVPAGGGVRWARALRWVSHSWTFVGEVGRALPVAAEALAVAEAAGEPAEIAHAVRRHGEALRDLDRFGEAEAALRRALTMFAELGEGGEEIEVRAALGVLYNVTGRYDQSRPMLHEALARIPAGADTAQRGWVLVGLALAHRLSGDPQGARRWAAEASTLAVRIGDRYLLGFCHQEAAWIAVDAGEYAEAEAGFGAMLRIFRALRVGSGAASALAGLGVVAQRRGDLDAAQAAFGEAEEAFRRLGDEIRASMWHGHRATVLARRSTPAGPAEP